MRRHTRERCAVYHSSCGPRAAHSPSAHTGWVAHSPPHAHPASHPGPHKRPRPNPKPRACESSYSARHAATPAPEAMRAAARRRRASTRLCRSPLGPACNATPPLPRATPPPRHVNCTSMHSMPWPWAHRTIQPPPRGDGAVAGEAARHVLITLRHAGRPLPPQRPTPRRAGGGEGEELGGGRWEAGGGRWEEAGGGRQEAGGRRR